MGIGRLLGRIGKRFDDQESGVKTCRRNVGTTALIFVHGLSGSVEGTWKDMLQVVGADPDLKDLSYDCYAYPSPLLRIPFTKRSSGIRELTSGLRTYIDTYHPEDTEVVLVGHSLGGVVARQFVIEELKARRGERIRGIALYASPRTGVALADVGSRLSWRHRHLRQLGKQSDLLDSLNEDWLSLAVEENIPTVYVVGGTDAIVPPSSGCARLGADNVKLVAEHGHASIIEPLDGDDLRFKVLKQFLIRDCRILRSSAVRMEPVLVEPGDVLFDVYSRAVEPFYVRREIDRLLTLVTTSAHAWVSGPSGMGKTAALRRLADLAGWRMCHIMLGSYQGLAPLALLREICSELHERLGMQFDAMPSPTLANLLPLFRRVIRRAAETGPVAILVEEIPISAETGLSDFIAGISHLAVSAETDGMASRVVWLFSSIADLQLNLSAEHMKFRERVQVLKATRWADHEVRELARLIEVNLDVSLAAGISGKIVSQARGNPRFVKIFYRRLRTEPASGVQVDELLSAVARDLFGDE